jgi:TP901 family phage tail tape measure protein
MAGMKVGTAFIDLQARGDQLFTQVSSAASRAGALAGRSLNQGVQSGYSGIMRGAAGAGAAISTIGTRTQSVGQSITQAGTRFNSWAAPAAGAARAVKPLTLGVAAAGAAVIKTGMDFDTSMAKLIGVTNAPAAEIAKLEQKARQLGATTKFSASEAADGMGFLAMAGMKTNDIIAVTPHMLDLAAAANMDLARTSDVVTNIMSGMRLKTEESGHAVDVLAKAASSGNVDIEMLGQSFKYAGPVAAAFGMSLEEAAAAMAVLGDNGLQADMAGTGLKGMLVALNNESGKAAKVAKKYGFSLQDQDGKFIGLTESVNKFAKANVSTSEIMDAFGQRAGPAFLALIGDASREKLNMLSGSLDDSAGAARRMAAAYEESAKGRLQNFLSAVQELALQLWDGGMRDAVKNTLDGLTSLARGFGTLPGWVKQGTVALALFPVGIFAVAKSITGTQRLIMGFGSSVTNAGKVIGGLGRGVSGAVSALGRFGSGFSNASAASSAFSGTMGTLGGKARQAANAIGSGLGAAATKSASALKTAGSATLSAATGLGQYLTKAKLASAATRTWTAIQAAFNAVMAMNPFVLIVVGIVALIAALVLAYNKVGWFRDFVNAAFSMIRDVTVVVWAVIKGVILGVWDAIKPYVQAAVQFISTVIKTHFEIMKTIITTVMNVIQSVISAVWGVIKAVWNAAVSFLSPIVQTHFLIVKTVITTVMNAVKAVITTVWNAIKAVWNATVNALKPPVTSAFNAIKSTITTVMNAMKSVISTVWGAIKSVFTTGVNAVKSSVSLFVGAIQTAAKSPQKLTDAVRSGIGQVVGFFKGLPGQITGALGNMGSLLYNKGRDVVQGLINGIKSMAGAVGSAVSNVASKLNPGNWFKMSIPGMGGGDEGAPGGPGFAPMMSRAGIPSLAGGPTPFASFASFARSSPVEGAFSDINRAMSAAVDSGMGSANVDLGGFEKRVTNAASESYRARPSAAPITVNARTDADPYEIGKAIAWEMRTSGR